MVFLEQRAHGFDIWQEPLLELRTPKLFDMLGEPFERAKHEASGDDMWRLERLHLILPAVAYVSQHLATYQDFPLRQKTGSFILSQVLAKLQSNSGQ